jgi:hypothetical protein
MSAEASLVSPADSIFGQKVSRQLSLFRLGIIITVDACQVPKTSAVVCGSTHHSQQLMKHVHVYHDVTFPGEYSGPGLSVFLITLSSVVLQVLGLGARHR